MEFIFQLTKYNNKEFLPQISKALEKRVELSSREKLPQMWKFTDKINSIKKMPEDVLLKRRKRYKVYGILLLVIGFFALILSLTAPKELLSLLIVGSLSIILGIGYLAYVNNSKKAKSTEFDKAAIKLFNEYESIDNCQIKFIDKKIELIDNKTILYNEIEAFIFTEAFYVIIWNDKITILQKQDLYSANEDEFISFINEKSKNLFSVINI